MKSHLQPRHFLTIIGSLVLLLACGCASSGNFTMMQPVSAKLSQYKSVTVEVKSKLTKPANLHEFMEQLESRIVVRLRNGHAFGKIYTAADTDSHADLRITVSITKVYDLGIGDRIMWGGMAGQATTHGFVELTDQTTGKLIGSGEIIGRSSDNGTIWSGTTSEAVDRAADAVVDLVEKNM
jgi:hypothetical protein